MTLPLDVSEKLEKIYMLENIVLGMSVIRKESTTTLLLTEL
jgi:hypothetical protein